MRFFNKRSRKVGLAPGTPVHVGEERPEPVVVRAVDYGLDVCCEQKPDSVRGLPEPGEECAVRWIDVSGVHDIRVIEEIGSKFDLHPLVMEDIANTAQRPKVEDYDDYIYLVGRMLRYNEQTREAEDEQISIVLGSGLVISFQERGRDLFAPVRDRITNAKGRIRKTGADYLAYALVDTIVDGYFGVLERVGENLEDLQEEVTGEPTEDTLNRIHSSKRELVFLRKSVWPLREAINSLARSDTELLTDNTRLYLRDVYDHTIQVIDTLESFRDLAAGMLDTYLTSISNRMNEVMKVLTIMASLFIPLTFIAGIYGMNFEHMPELGWRWSYPIVLGLMYGIAVFMLMYFKKKNWV